MKNYLMLLAVSLPLLAAAQSANVQSAADWLKRYNDLPKARDFIDQAHDHSSTANDPKMWYYYGKIYWAIYRDTTHAVDDPDAVMKSADGFINCLATDTKNAYGEECNNMVWVTGLSLFNQAVVAYNANDLPRAERYYKRVMDVFPLDKDNNLKRNNVTADLVTKNLYAVASKSGDNEKAKGYLQQLIDVKYNDPMIYIYMSRILLEEKDTARALTYIEKGRTLFDENTNLQNAEMNIYLSMGKLNVLIDKLSAVIENDPENEVLYYKRGFLYESIKDEPHAEADYRKALELNPDYFDANYAMGVLLFNEAAKMANAANELKTDAEFTKAKEKFDAKFKESETYLEASVELNPKKTEEDMNLYRVALNSLKQYYVRTGQNDKYEKVKQQLEQ